MRRALIHVLCVALAVGLAGCGKDPGQELTERYIPVAKARFALLDAVAAKCANLPEIKREEIDRRSRLDFRPNTKNILILDVAELVDFAAGKESTQDPWGVALGTEIFKLRTLRGLERLDEWSIYPSDFEDLERIQYVLVIARVAHTDPAVRRTDIGGPSRFTGGTIKGEGHLFRLEDAEHLGAVRFEAQNSEVIDYSSDGWDTYEAATSARGAVRRDLLWNGWKALVEAVRQRGTSVKVANW